MVLNWGMVELTPAVLGERGGSYSSGGSVGLHDAPIAGGQCRWQSSSLKGSGSLQLAVGGWQLAVGNWPVFRCGL